MKIALLKSKLRLINEKLLEFRKNREDDHPKPEYERLFVDFKQIVSNLKQVDQEIFDDLIGTLSPITKTVQGLHKSYTVYNKSQLELLLFEVEKAISYISILETEKTVDSTNSNPFSVVNIITSRFHNVARQLRKRHNDKETLNVIDEYDVQDLFHALLRLFFDDIRPESYVPLYAGGNSRIDFVLKNENIAIEIKKSRSTLKSKELGEQLIIDIDRYKVYPDIDTLFCFVYDPDGWIENPTGIENDLCGQRGNLNIIVRIEPKL
jgi:hypothetical protein